MKKLMIAAAMAAMIGGVEAGEFGSSDFVASYDVTASVYGMTGKKGKDKSTKYTVKLGKNDAGEFWYQDSVIEWDGTKGTVVGVECVYAQDDGTGEADLTKKCELKFAANVTEEEKEEVAIAFGFDGKDTTYKFQSSKKWCATFKYTHTDLAKCYRVAKNYKLYGRADTVNCCEIGYFAGAAIFSRFGGATIDAAKDVDFVSGTDREGYKLVSKDGEVAGRFVFAGRGKWSDNLMTIEGKKYAGVSSLSGYCIGYQTSDITCAECCESDEDAIQFTCDDGDWEEDEYFYYPGMAGTFTAKFNKNDSGLD